VIAVHSDVAILAEAGRGGQGRAARSGPDRALAREETWTDRLCLQLEGFGDVCYQRDR
jgi:hypothetical protein